MTRGRNPVMIGSMVLAILCSQPGFCQSRDDPSVEILILTRTIFAALEQDTSFRQMRNSYGACLKHVADQILPSGQLPEFVFRMKFDCAAARASFVTFTATLIRQMPDFQGPSGPLAETKVTLDEIRLIDLFRKQIGEL